MTNCFYCNHKIEDIPYRCKFCGLTFCSEHRLPENHSCSYDLKIKLNNFIYNDTLEYMNKKLTVANIYDYVTRKKLTKADGIKLLRFLIENSENIEDRINSLRALELLNLNNKEAYRILENCIISDENPKVRKIAAKILIKFFPKESKRVLKWINNHDNQLSL